MPRPELSLVIPVYNEEEVLPQLAVRLRELAPHLIRPLPVLVRTGGRLAEHPVALRAALAVYDALGGRAARPGPAEGFPAPGLLDRAACRRLFPEAEEAGWSGGALWYDAQAIHPERLTLEFVLAAAEAGAEVCTYLEVRTLLAASGRARARAARPIWSSPPGA